MERTRDELMHLLQARGECSVAELAESIGVSEGSIRRHMDLMVADGLLSVRQVRQPRGRPAARYSLSEAGEERSSAAHYSRLLDRISPALASLGEADVAGLDGRGVLDRLFEELGEARARDHAASVRAERLDERVHQVTAALRDEGILSEVSDEGDSFRLSNLACPYRSCAEDHHAPCDADRRTIEMLIGLPVVQLSTVAGGGDSCEYLVAKSDERVPRREHTDVAAPASQVC